MPPISVLKESSRKNLFFESKSGKPKLQKDKKDQLIQPNTLNLDNILKNADKKFVDFIKKCLV